MKMNHVGGDNTSRKTHPFQVIQATRRTTLDKVKDVENKPDTQ